MFSTFCVVIKGPVGNNKQIKFKFRFILLCIFVESYTFCFLQNHDSLCSLYSNILWQRFKSLTSKSENWRPFTIQKPLYHKDCFPPPLLCISNPKGNLVLQLLEMVIRLWSMKILFSIKTQRLVWSAGGKRYLWIWV